MHSSASVQTRHKSCLPPELLNFIQVLVTFSVALLGSANAHITTLNSNPTGKPWYYFLSSEKQKTRRNRKPQMHSLN